MTSYIDTGEFMGLRKTLSVLDVRSPLEFEAGHIPGAINLPLFDNQERTMVGTAYKKSGREKAMLVGLEYAGKKLTSYVSGARRAAANRKVLMHCWRGGMRSESMAWLLSLAGFDVFLLKGGYKAYRKYIRKLWETPGPFIVLSGKTGTGKTDILNYLEKTGQQVIDLEGYAHHKGSAFGSLGELPQPTNEQFENDLADKWLKLDHSQITWAEDESRSIGRVSIPEKLNETIHSCTTVCLDMPENLRIDRLVHDYAAFPKPLLKQSVEKIRRKLGGQNANKAIEAIENEDFRLAVSVVLKYYDKTYSYDLAKREPRRVFSAALNRKLAYASVERATLSAFLI
ncbi:MAG: tRNA 2-selenouridine(34) synthase MnmH [Bacteroidales bacterium]